MLISAQRLRHTKDITAVYQYGHKRGHRLLRLYAKPSQLSHSRATVVVSQQVDRRAVGRNLIKRRLRAALTMILPNLAAPHDIVIVANPAAAKADYQALQQALISTCQQQHLYDPIQHFSKTVRAKIN
ncbi:MAG: ribonuclease P protein component [Candidatus Kerfeldbacteria bacterium]|nr:ribonuclease P protein component [Candidatus Kerfeldbacteria bacterium]